MLFLQSPQLEVGHSGPVYTAAFSPEGLCLLTASHDRTVKFWDTAGGGCERTLAKLERTIHSAVWSPDGALIATATDDSEVVIWDAESLQELQRVRAHSQKASGWVVGEVVGQVFSVQFSHDSLLLLTASMDGSARRAGRM